MANKGTVFTIKFFKNQCKLFNQSTEVASSGGLGSTDILYCVKWRLPFSRIELECDSNLKVSDRSYPNVDNFCALFNSPA